MACPLADPANRVTLTFAMSLFLGFISLRLSGHYLPLGTIAWGISLYFLFAIWSSWEAIPESLVSPPSFLRSGARLRPQVPLPYLDPGFAGATIDSQSARFAFRPGYSRLEGRGLMAEELRREYRPDEDRHLYLCRATRQPVRLAVRALAALRQPTPFRSTPASNTCSWPWSAVPPRSGAPW